jgi:hypothetical protein
MFDQIALNKLITQLVPAKYFPSRDPHKPDPCVIIDVWPASEVQEYSYRLSRNTNTILGLMFSYEALFAQSGFSPKPLWCGKFGIILSAALDIEQAKFTLMHEVGHLDWEMSRANPEATVIEKERYANAYAIMMLGAAFNIEAALALRDRCTKIGRV